MNDHRPAIVPPALRQGDLIGVAAPAGPFPEDRFHAGLDRLGALGFRTLVPDAIFESDGYLAGSDQRRADVLNGLLRNPDVKAVIAARGGYGSMRILDLVDYEALKSQPRIVMGFSDITALLAAIYKHTGLVTTHGPVVTSLADADEVTVDWLRELLAGRPLGPVSLEPGQILRPGRVAGPLFGGNLTLITHLLSTGHLPDLSGCILLIEDTGEAPYRLDRMLTTLRLAGILERLGGIVAGYFDHCGDDLDIRRVLENTLGDFRGPAAVGLPVGHGPRNLALPLGAMAVLDADSLEFVVENPFHA